MPVYDNENRDNVTQVQLLPERTPATASPITKAYVLNRNAYVLSGDCTLFIIPADEVIQFNSRYVTVRNNRNLETYDFMGELRQSKPI